MEWLLYMCFNFVLYSFLGWIIEEIYSFFSRGYFKEEGFLNIPFKPMYGIAMCILIFIYFRINISKSLLLLLCLVVPTIVEYISGYLLKHFFNETYWSYSNQSCNLQGFICLKFSIYWMVLTYITLLFIQPVINKVYKNFSALSNLLAVILLIYILLDLVLVGVSYYKKFTKVSKSEVCEYRSIKKKI